MTIALLNKDNLLKKIGGCIKECRKNKVELLTILTPPGIYMNVCETLKNHHKVDRVRFGSQTVFIIEEMKIEVRKIDGYV
mgnify:CR=1 FL=1|tara:strand:+ start:8529 stop:8768 length:240 start_codon:yes stop_codon:yes gene_type:complete